MERYVTYLNDGSLDGCYLQVPPPSHIERMIRVDESLASNWTTYRATADRTAIELAPTAAVDVDTLKADLNGRINDWRAAANMSTFPHAGKRFACDALSRSDIDGVANHVALFDAFPEGFPGGWKATDNTMLPLPDVDAFRAMYASMTAQGTENFNRSQELKARLAVASTPDEIAAITW